MPNALAVLRNRKTKTAEFRVAAQALALRLARRTAVLFKKKHRNAKQVVVVPVLRSGIALLEGALRTFPGASVGVLGLKRDERTFAPAWYYENLPTLSKNSTVIILDPMLATGGSAEAVATRLIERGARAEHIFFLGIIAAPEGLARLAQVIPQENIILATVDTGLTAQKMITPGLGDFGDRYFGTSGKSAQLY